MKKYILSLFNTFFVERSTLYSLHLAGQHRSTPMGEWYRGLNAPRVGEAIAIEINNAEESRGTKEFNYYRVVTVCHIILAKSDKLEAVVVVVPIYKPEGL